MDMLRDDPKDSFLRYAISLELSKAGRIHDAITELEKLYSDEPSYLALYYQLGHFYQATAQPEKALQMYEEGVKIAQDQREMKTLAELREAIQQLD